MNEIVKYDNYMNKLSFKKFKAVELDLLMVLCSKLKGKETNVLVLTFSELKKISGDTKHSNKEYVDSLKSMNKKLMEIICEIEMDGKIIMFVLFPTFEIDIVNKTLTICVNEKFKFILNELTKNFTRFDLREFIELDSKYSKNLYRLLKQFKTTGRYDVNINDFKDKMDCPKSYKNKYVMDLIIKPALNDLQKYFEDLTCTVRYAHKKGNPVIGYTFTFTPEKTTKCIDDECVQEYDRGKSKNRFINFNQREYDFDSLEKELLRR